MILMALLRYFVLLQCIMIADDAQSLLSPIMQQLNPRGGLVAKSGWVAKQ